MIITIAIEQSSNGHLQYILESPLAIFNSLDLNDLLMEVREKYKFFECLKIILDKRSIGEENISKATTSYIVILQESLKTCFFYRIEIDYITVYPEEYPKEIIYNSIRESIANNSVIEEIGMLDRRLPLDIENKLRLNKSSKITSFSAAAICFHNSKIKTMNALPFEIRKLILTYLLPERMAYRKPCYLDQYETYPWSVRYIRITSPIFLPDMKSSTILCDLDSKESIKDGRMFTLYYGVEQHEHKHLRNKPLLFKTLDENYNEVAKIAKPDFIVGTDRALSRLRVL